MIEVSNKDATLAAKFAIEQAQKEGWNPGLDDANTFPYADKNGIFIGTLDGEIIGSFSCVCYDEKFAFTGCFAVKQLYRQSGYGWGLLKAGLSYAGDRCVGCDAVLEMEAIYSAKFGMTTDFVSHRYAISVDEINSFPVDVKVQSFNLELFNYACDYDRQCFPAARVNFLRAWLTAPHALSWCYMAAEQCRGFIVLRQCVSGYKIGPLFADDIHCATALLNAALSAVNNTEVYIDIPVYQSLFCQKLLDDYRAKSVFACARMYLQGKPSFAKQQVYGISSFELG